jgi:hypothetical protein
VGDPSGIEGGDVTIGLEDGAAEVSGLGASAAGDVGGGLGAGAHAAIMSGTAARMEAR